MAKKPAPNQLQHLENQITDLDSKFKRALADYQNLEKRHSQDKQNLIRFANENLLHKLLSVLDDLERAQNHLNDSGLGLVISQFYRQLESEGVKAVDSTGKPFNPETMDCTDVVAGEKNQVVKTVIKGYLYHDKVLRPAKVEVGSGMIDSNQQKEKPEALSPSESVNNIN